MRLCSRACFLSLCLSFLVSAPALAAWSADNATISGSYSGNSGSGGGAQAYYGNSANGVSYSENPDTSGTLTSGGATWTISRNYYINSGSPATYGVQIGLSVSVMAAASGYGMMISAYADSRGKANGHLDFWPDLRQLDETVSANAPPGESPSDGDNTDSDANRVYTANGDVTVQATLYVLTSAWANGGTSSSESSAQSYVSFSTPP